MMLRLLGKERLGERDEVTFTMIRRRFLIIGGMGERVERGGETRPKGGEKPKNPHPCSPRDSP